MDQRSSFLIQTLEKLAAPLVAAISEVTVRQMMTQDQAGNTTSSASLKNEAQQLASLLTSTTQLSISLSDLMDLQNMGDKADAVRVGLAGVASPLIANFYRLAGRYPTESEIERLKSAMSTVVTYADNFEAAGEAQARLATFDQDFRPMDQDQQLLQYMFVLLPAVNSILAYPFGQPEKKLVQEVCDRLIKSVKAMQEKLFNTQDDVTKAKSEMALLRIAALIYSQCHFAEMAKLMASEDQNRQGMAPPMDNLWSAFEQRLSMLEVLAETLLPNRAAGETSSGSKTVRPEPRNLPPAQTSKETAPPAPPPVAEKPATDPANPMSFFAKKSG